MRAMKVTLYLAISINGKIANEHDQVSWSEELRQAYAKNVKQAWALIVGRRSYELMKEADEFEMIGHPRTVVITHRDLDEDLETFSTATDPRQALDLLRDGEYEEIFVGGWAEIATLFLQERLIDEILLDVEPYVYGMWVPLFNQTDLSAKLKLLSTRQLNDDTIQLRYKLLWWEDIVYL